MKEGTTHTRLAILAVALGLLAYFGVYVWRGLTDPLITTYAYAYTVNDSVEAGGFLVREEQILPTQAGIIEVVLDEGEKVGRNQMVAAIYQTSAALDRDNQIKDLELEIELLEYAIAQAGETASSSQLESDVIQAVVTLRANAAAGDFARLEDQVVALKQAVLKRDYTYGGADTSRLSGLKDQLRALQAQSSRDVSRIYVGQPGVFSAQVDGYESLLTPGSVTSLTPSALDSLAFQGTRGDDTAVGKLITSSTWYFVTALDAQAVRRLSEGGRVTVRFSGDFSQDVRMRVESIGAEENGRWPVVLSSDRYLSSTTLLRQQTAELIFQTYEGLRVPKGAVHIETRQTTDSDGAVQETKVTGVYAVVNGRAEFKEVETLAEGSEFYVVRALDEDRTLLRPGDEVIVQARGLYNGKVVY